MKRIERLERQLSQTTFARMVIGNVVRTRVNSHPFLRNYQSAIEGHDKKGPRITERLLLDICDPHSEVSYILLAGLPGSGKTTFADALAAILSETFLGTMDVRRESFTFYRELAKKDMEKRRETWTKERETEIATHFMTISALRVMREGPRIREKRRVVIGEMPIYPVDDRERGLELLKAIGKTQKDIPSEQRRARVLFLKPDLGVILNGIMTRILKKSSGGSADMLYEIALKAYGGAMMFRKTQPELYKRITRLIKDKKGLHLPGVFNLSEQTEKIIAVRMLLLLHLSGLYSSLDTVVMNPHRKHLRRLSRQYPQQTTE